MLHAIILLRKILSMMVLIGLIEAVSTPQKADKPDMQKVYDEAKDWSHDKLDQMPNTKIAHATAGIGVCRGASIGEPLMLKPPCSKKQNQKIDDVVDAVTDDHPYEAKDTSQAIETSRNFHPDILSSSQNQAPKILVFVSFSMPKASLRALAKEALKHHAVLVMRGLKGDSFKTTQQAFLELANESNNPNLDTKAIIKNIPDDMQGFEVNPELFKTYQVKKVPTFVLVQGEQEVSRLSGNVSLEYAAKKLKESL